MSLQALALIIVLLVVLLGLSVAGVIVQRLTIRELARDIRLIRDQRDRHRREANDWQVQALDLRSQLDLTSPRRPFAKPDANGAIRRSLAKLRPGDTKDGGSSRGSITPSSRSTRHQPATYVPDAIDGTIAAVNWAGASLLAESSSAPSPDTSSAGSFDSGSSGSFDSGSSSSSDSGGSFSSGDSGSF